MDADARRGRRSGSRTARLPGALAEAGRRATSRAQAAARWRPLVDRGLRARAVAAVHSIAALLREPDPRAGASLALGDAGTAVLFAYLARAGFPCRGARGLARDYAERAARAVATTAMPLGLLDGAAGVAWTLHHLRGRELPGRDLCGSFDAVLRGAVRRGALDARHDLTGGLAGLLIYALARGDRAFAAEVVARLAATSVSCAGGVAWRDVPDARGVGGEARVGDVIDLGTAHGAAGVVAALAQAAAREIPGAAGLCGASARWLRAQARWGRRGRAPGGSVFPAKQIIGGAADGPCRLAWCYGDLGMACALSVASAATRDPALAAAASRLAGCAAQRAPETSGVVDRGVCHGAAGLALGLQRLHAVTGDRAARDAARSWLSLSLDDALTADALDADAGHGRGLLGAAGLGLVYLASLTSRVPRWSSALALVPVSAR